MSGTTELQKDVESLRNRVGYLEAHGAQDLENDLKMGRLLQTLGKEVHLLRDVVVAAAAIRRKINGHLRLINVDAWLGPELRALDAAFKAVEGGGGV
jgi:hypothetical protein